MNNTLGTNQKLKIATYKKNKLPSTNPDLILALEK